MRMSIVLFGLLAVIASANGFEVRRCLLDMDRLPERVSPTNYRISFDFNNDTTRYTAQVVIDMLASTNKSQECKARGSSKLIACDPTQIVLHIGEQVLVREAKFMIASNAKNPASFERAPIKEMCRDPSQEMLVIWLKKGFKAGSVGQLKMNVAGLIRNDFRGIHILRSNDVSRGYTIATQFRPGDARKAFPCFDEPHFKTPFTIEIEHPEELRALSNADVESVDSIKGTGLSTTRFAPTKPMSTYLVGFVVGQFDHTSSVFGKNDKRVNLWTPPGKIRDALFMTQHAARALGALEHFFDLELPLNKVDVVTLPLMTTGSMENWGLVTLLEQIAYANTTTDLVPPGTVMFSVSALVHSLAHQWWGNLVGMSSWDEMWLNEAVVEWLSLSTNRLLEPSWNFDLIHQLADRSDALDQEVDSTKTIAGLAREPSAYLKDEELTKVFGKSVAIVSMLSSYVGVENFRQGLQEYMRAHLFGSSTAADLWTRLEAISGLPVSTFVNSWTGQAGFPLLHVRLSGDGRHLELSQNRYTKNASVAASGDGQVWHVPVSVEVSDSSDNVAQLQQALTGPTGELELPEWFDASKPGHWVKVNAHAVGFYRVKYDDERLWAALGEAVKAKYLNSADRLNVLQDIEALYRSGRLDVGTASEALGWFGEEDEDGVVVALSDVWDLVRARGELHETELTRGFETLVNYYQRTGAFKLNVDDQSLLKRRARSEVIHALIRNADQLVTADASRALAQVLSGAKLPIGMRSALVRAIAETGSDGELDQLLKYLRANLTRAELVQYASELKHSVRDKKRAMYIARTLKKSI